MPPSGSPPSARARPRAENIDRSNEPGKSREGSSPPRASSFSTPLFAAALFEPIALGSEHGYGAGSRRRQLPLGVELEVFVRREDAERFIEEVRGDDPELADYLRIEEGELEAGGLN